MEGIASDLAEILSVQEALVEESREDDGPQSWLRAGLTLFYGSGASVVKGYLKETYHNNIFAIGYRWAKGETPAEKSYFLEGYGQAKDNLNELGRSVSSSESGFKNDYRRAKALAGKAEEVISEQSQIITDKANQFFTKENLFKEGMALLQNTYQTFAGAVWYLNNYNPFTADSLESYLNCVGYTLDYSARFLMGEKTNVLDVSRDLSGDVYALSQGKGLEAVIDTQGIVGRMITGVAVFIITAGGKFKLPPSITAFLSRGARLLGKGRAGLFLRELLGIGAKEGTKRALGAETAARAQVILRHVTDLGAGNMAAGAIVVFLQGGFEQKPGESTQAYVARVAQQVLAAGVAFRMGKRGGGSSGSPSGATPSPGASPGKVTQLPTDKVKPTPPSGPTPNAGALPPGASTPPPTALANPAKPGALDLPGSNTNPVVQQGPSPSLTAPVASSLPAKLDTGQLEPTRNETLEQIQDPKEEKPKKLELKDITREMVLAYYGGEEIFGETIEEKDIIFRDKRDRFIKVATKLTGSSLEARRLALARELAHYFPFAKRENLMEVIDVSDQLSTMKTMLEYVNNTKAHPAHQKKQLALKTDLERICNTDKKLNYLDFMRYTDQYIELFGSDSPTDRIPRSLSLNNLVYNAKKLFPGVYFRPTFDKQGVADLSSTWAIGLRPVALLRPFSTNPYDGGDGNGIEMAQHDYEDHAHQWGPNRDLDEVTQSGQIRLNYEEELSYLSERDALLLDVLWFDLDHDNTSTSNVGLLDTVDVKIISQYMVDQLSTIDRDMPLSELKNQNIRHLSLYVERILDPKYYGPELSGFKIEDLTAGDLLDVLLIFNRIVHEDLD